MEVTTERKPAWLEEIAPERFNDYELFRIVIFFVFHSPCKNLSAMGKPLNEYGWRNPWKQPYYLNKQLIQATKSGNLIKHCKSYAKMGEVLEQAGMLEHFPSNLSKERICIYDKEKNQSLSVFYHIRNAFAHGRLNMRDVSGECVFILEDVRPSNSSDRLTVSARMILRKSTLLKWIDLIEGGEKEYEAPPKSKKSKSKK